MPLREFDHDYAPLRKRLLQARRHNRVGHAYLFVGDNADFLERFGRAWIQVCACTSPAADGDACGECRDCRQIADRTYPELHELRPQSKSRLILVDEMRELEHQFQLTTRRGLLKAGLIIEADRLNEQAQNAFLKTLEEPPAHSMLVLLTTHPRALLPTIRSRCQTISLLQNRRDYEFPISRGLFEHLGRLRRNAGAAVALAVSHRIQDLLTDLRAMAEQTSDIPQNQEGTAREEEQDPAFRKRLDEIRKARVQAEYLRLRAGLTEAIEAWFLQRSLAARGIADADLPHPELIKAAKLPAAVLTELPDEEAEHDAREAGKLRQFLTTNLDERLAMDVFCLTVCKKNSN
jgi:DNA polymerase-3 subunit delta'